jgi:serine/threonine protein kinase
VFATYYKDNLDKQIAVKVLPYGKKLETLSNKELGIACELNDLSKLSPIFVKTLGYIVCNKIPEEWKEQMFYQDESLYIMMFMHKPQAEFAVSGGMPGAYKVMGFGTRDMAISLLFVLLHGIYIGRKFLQFVHHDIHEGNVMFSGSLRKDPTHFHLKVEDSMYRVEFVKNWVPKLIDFGKSSTLKHPDERAKNTGTDVKTVFRLFKKRIDLQKAINLDEEVNNKELLESKCDDSQILADFLQNDKLFTRASTIEKMVKRRKVEEEIDACVVCGAGPVQLEYNNRKGKVCHEFCGRQIEPISNLLPFK